LTLRLSHATCSYIYMYINAVANSVMLELHLRTDFYNITFKIIITYIYIASGPAPLTNEKFWVRARLRPPPDEKEKSIRVYGTSVPIYQTIRPQIPEDHSTTQQTILSTDHSNLFSVLVQISVKVSTPLIRGIVVWEATQRDTRGWGLE
jgi:hypothetical protein